MWSLLHNFRSEIISQTFALPPWLLGEAARALEDRIQTNSQEETWENLKVSRLNRGALAGEQNARALMKKASVGNRHGGLGWRRKEPLCLEEM